MERFRWLVTGGAGFIGSHIVERLLKEGHYVRVLDNFSSGKEENLDFVLSAQEGSPLPIGERVRVRGKEQYISNFDLIRGDIRDYPTCLEACDSIDYISHQAALRSVPKSMEMPHEYNAVNIDGSLNILEAALKSGVKRVVLASSSSVYGDVTRFPEKETDLPLLISPYALSKLTAEYYSRIFSENHGLETVNLRYFNVFGPRQALDDEYAVVIPKFIHCILNDEQPPIFGNGKQSRDFTYIDNVVEANILAATQIPSPPKGERVRVRGQYKNVGAASGRENKIPSPPKGERVRVRGQCISEAPPIAGSEATKQSQGSTLCEILNVANGNDNTVLQLVDYLNKIIGKDIKPAFLPIRQGDVFRTLADVSKIKNILNFKPTVSFEEGLRKTVEWFKEQYLVGQCA